MLIIVRFKPRLTNDFELKWQLLKQTASIEKTISASVTTRYIKAVDGYQLVAHCSLSAKLYCVALKL